MFPIPHPRPRHQVHHRIRCRLYRDRRQKQGTGAGTPANAIAERFVGSIRRELLDRILIINQGYGSTSGTTTITVYVEPWPKPLPYVPFTRRQLVGVQSPLWIVAVGRIDLATAGTPDADRTTLKVAERYLHILGVTGHPDGSWTTPLARSLVIGVGEDVTRFRFLVRDLARQFTASLDAVFADADIEVVKIPQRCPRANCYAERLSRRCGPNSPTTG